MTNCYSIDVFVGPGLAGNTAGVCVLPAFPPPHTMQKIAASNGYSQTAFVVPKGSTDFDLRWFTPTIEDNLCGHATLASAFALKHEGQELWPVKFHTRSGILAVRFDGDSYELGLPVWRGQRIKPPAKLLEALRLDSAEVVMRTRDFLVVVESADIVRSANPNFRILKALVPGLGGVILTAAGDNDVDYVVRFFAPAVGIDEDPATGSAACTHAPYWASRLGKTSLRVRQLSVRGGAMTCRVDDHEVHVGGRATLVGMEPVA